MFSSDTAQNIRCDMCAALFVFFDIDILTYFTKNVNKIFLKQT